MTEPQHADATNGGQNGPSGSVENGQETLEKFARQLGALVIGQEGKLTPEAQSQIDLRSDEERGKVLLKLVSELRPSEVSPGIWLRWLEGGDSPFSSRGIKRPVKQSQGTGKSLARGPASLRVHRDRVAKARAELEYAEEALAYHEAMDKSLLDWCVMDHLIKVLSPIFAMGPAWTIMRSLSGHMSDDEANMRALFYEGEEKQDEIKRVRALHMEEARKMMEVLDRWSGDPEFELSLRKAVLRVVNSYGGSEDDAFGNGSRRRSESTARETINPRGLESAEDIIRGEASRVFRRLQFVRRSFRDEQDPKQVFT